MRSTKNRIEIRIFCCSFQNLALWPLALILLTGFSAAEDLEVKRGRDGKLCKILIFVGYEMENISYKM